MKTTAIIASLFLVLGIFFYTLFPTTPSSNHIAQVSTSTAPITGTFISFPWSKARNFSPQQWEKEFKDMAQIGIKNVIVAGVHVANYSQVQDGTYYAHLDAIFTNATHTNMTVYISPVDYNNYYTSTENRTRLIDLSKQYALEIKNRGYTNKSEFAGWYVQEEALLNVDYNDYSSWKVLADYYKSLTPNKKVLTAPYYLAPCYPGRFRCNNQWWPNKNPTEMAANAKKFIENTNIDILAVQDGVGASGITIAELNEFLPAMNQAIISAGKEFWVDAEIFRYTPDHSTFVPASINSLTAQLTALQNYPITIWIYDFMSQQNDTASQDLFTAYLQHYNILPSAPMYYYHTQNKACGQTISSYSDVATCQTNLGLYMSGQTTGICYPTLTECQTAHPPLKRGDLNSDSKVDIFDFNLLISKFGNPYTIFDFNDIVVNFGK